MKGPGRFVDTLDGVDASGDGSGSSGSGVCSSLAWTCAWRICDVDPLANDSWNRGWKRLPGVLGTLVLLTLEVLWISDCVLAFC
jgi:hypothetical protein